MVKKKLHATSVIIFGIRPSNFVCFFIILGCMISFACMCVVGGGGPCVPSDDLERLWSV